MRQRRRMLGLGGSWNGSSNGSLSEDKKLRELSSTSFAGYQLQRARLKPVFTLLLVIVGTALLLTVLTVRMVMGGFAFRHSQPKPVYQPTDTYDIFHCPELPPEGYPREYPILDVLRHWNVKTLVSPQRIHQGICVFDCAINPFSPEVLQLQIRRYRDAEVPFVVRNDPAVLNSVALWKKEGYLSNKLDGKRYQATLSNTTTVTYFSLDPNYNDIPESFVAPTRHVPMTFAEWHTRANMEEQQFAYLRLDACLPDKGCDSTYRGNPQWIDDADFIYQDLPFFYPDQTSNQSWHSIDSTKARGIQCRFSTPGLIAETHFDNERNFIAMLKGERRFLLAHPKNCPYLHLYPQKHPLERHTRVDWAAVSTNQTYQNQYPSFANATINEVVLTAGDVLYLPTYWFHHIVSLTVNYQCNTRSGYSVEYDQTIYDCGFFYDFPA